MGAIIGREAEIRRLDRVLSENVAQLVAVYGRRRVGKTFLINEYFEGKFDFKFTGSFDQSKQEQLKNFSRELGKARGMAYEVPKDWSEAFFLLRDYLSEGMRGGKQIVFFDEMPWMDNQKSGFLSAFEYFWNSWGSAQNHLVFIVCGSATAWMTEKLDKNLGGLFNRMTCRLFLEPFNLHETEKYLESRNIFWSRYDIVQCYMIMGGIPYYLRLLDREISLNENIDNLFFRKRAALWDEFDHLYRTLFSNSEQYIKIAEALSRKRRGLSREEIVKATGLPANGVLTKMLANLENSGFIRVNSTYGYPKKRKTYQLCDYYSMFYFRFLKDRSGKDDRMWSHSVDHPSRTAWAGLTFEQVCKDHLREIKSRLGFASVMTEVSTWQMKGDEEADGAQIDLVMERRDRVINICEIKFSSGPFVIDKSYDMKLRHKMAAFREATGTTKTLQLTMITTFGVKRNRYSNLVTNEVSMDDLFEKLRE